MFRPDVSVIIVNWNTRDLLRRCVQSIYEHTHEVSFEIIVIDNDSHDGSQEMLARDFPSVRLIANRKNVGLIKGNNQGIAISKGKHLLLLNSDTQLLAGTIDDLVRFMEAHPEAGAAGPKILNPDGTRQYSGGSFPTPLSLFITSSGVLFSILARDRMVGRRVRSRIKYHELREVDWLSTACFIVRREVVEMVGPMDNGYAIYALDSDWCYEIGRLGWKIFYVPHIQIVHYHGQSLKKARGASTHTVSGDLLYADTLGFIEKHWGRRRALAARLAVLCGTVIQMIGWAGAYLYRTGRGRQLAKQEIEGCKRIIGVTFGGRTEKPAWMRD